MEAKSSANTRPLPPKPRLTDGKIGKQTDHVHGTLPLKSRPPDKRDEQPDQVHGTLSLKPRPSGKRDEHVHGTLSLKPRPSGKRDEHVHGTLSLKTRPPGKRNEPVPGTLSLKTRPPGKRDEPVPGTLPQREHRFTESGASLSPKEFLDQFADDLPQLVSVSHGEYGMIGLDTFSLGQVMLIHSYGTQSRVVTRDARGRTFSIPTDYPLKFKVIKSRSKELQEQSLSELLEQHPLPVQVRLSAADSVSFYIGPDKQLAKDILNMVLVDTYLETYMLANCLNTDTLEEKTVLVPVYLKDATLSMVTGIQGKNQEQWEEYYSGLLKQMKNIKVDIKMGNKDIAFLSEDREDDVCAHIKRRSWLKVTGEDRDTYNELFLEDVAVYNFVNEEALDDRKPPLPTRDEQSHIYNSSRFEDSEKSILPSRGHQSDDKIQIESHYKDDSHLYSTVLPRKRLSLWRYIKRKLGFKEAVCKDKGRAIEEVYADKISVIGELSISQLAQVLRQLKLDKHVRTFKKKQIDGSIAQELDKHVLQNELGFSSFETIKFMKFISTGHIPK